MVRSRNGRNVAHTIRDARFLMIDGMGHDLPEPVWEPIVDALAETITVHELRDGRYVALANDDGMVRSLVIPDLVVDVRALFAAARTSL